MRPGSKNANDRDSSANRPACRNQADLRCWGVSCPGLADPGACSQVAALRDWRKLSEAEQVARLSGPRATVDSSVRDAVNACPFRGAVLPISMQEDCDCRGRELTECRAGRGARPGRVTLRECLTCRGG